MYPVKSHWKSAVGRYVPVDCACGDGMSFVQTTWSEASCECDGGYGWDGSTSAESKATYEEIKKYVAVHNDGMKVSNLYIAQIKQKHGIIERENYNKPKSEKGGQPECPKEKEIAIEEALKYFQMIPSES